MKRGWFLLFCLIGVIGLSSLGSAALGITPAKQEFNFVPGAEYVVNYRVLSDKPDQEIELYVEGDLAQYATLSKSSVKGPSDFVFTLKLPDDLDVPGPHKLLVGAKELPTEDQFIGVVVNIRAVVYVYVPYPGKYIERSLNIPNGNVDEEVPVEAHVINRGKEDLVLDTAIYFEDSDGNLLEGSTMEFKQVILRTGEDRYFRKFLDTTGFSPGTYRAEARFNYGEEVIANDSFRIGSLFVNVTNFTDRLSQKGIQKFLINVESLWNDDLEEVYADVNISNDVESVDFRTPSITLGKWEIKALEGFVDTDELEGKYDVEVILRYAGKQTLAYGFLTIVTINKALIIGISIGILVIILAIGVLVWVIRRKSVKSKRKK